MGVRETSRWWSTCWSSLWSTLAAVWFAVLLGAGVAHAADQGAATPREAAKMDAEGQSAQARREVSQPLNNAPFWRDVREGVQPYQTTQVRGVGTQVLIQNEGEMWRQFRNGPITVIGGWIIVLMFLALLAFYAWRGKITLDEPRTGREILRFTTWERIVHWTTAITFCILAISGIVMLFGRWVVLPVMGYTIFSLLAQLSKNLHNFVGPLFVVCTILMAFTFARDNIWRKHDFTWLRRAGGLVSKHHVPAGKYNAGEKIWFWFGVILLGIAVSVSGLVLDFPNFEQGRQVMQVANIVHAVAAVLYMTMSLGHIYLGTVGMEGAYDAMRHGKVDETWAKEHHEIWYRDLAAGRRTPSAGPAPSGAVASSMKDGWKV